jgi:hypothetical protein
MKYCVQLVSFVLEDTLLERVEQGLGSSDHPKKRTSAAVSKKGKGQSKLNSGQHHVN